MKDLAEYFKAYDQTQLNKVASYLKEVREEEAARLSIGQEVRHIKLREEDENLNDLRAH